MLVQNQADVAAASYSLVEVEGGGKVYWKGWIKMVGGASGWGGGTQSPGKEMLILTVSSVVPNGSVKQQPVSVPQFFALLNHLDINGRKVNGDVSSLNCTGSRKGKDGKGGGEILGVKFGEVWMEASVSAVPKLNLSDYSTKVAKFVDDITSATAVSIMGLEVKVSALKLDLIPIGKSLPEGDEKESFRDLYKKVGVMEGLIKKKKEELNVVDDDDSKDNLPF